MAHIHTKPGQHDHTASAFIVRTDFDEPKLMLHFHKKLGMYLQFGGHIELDETPWMAVSHEILEESGYDIADLNLLQPPQRVRSVSGVKLHPVPVSSGTYIFSDTHFHTDIAYVFTTDSEPKQTSESDEFKYVSRQELASDAEYESVRDIGLFIFDVCLLEWVIAEQADFA